MKIEIDLRIILLILIFLMTSRIDIYGIFIFFIFLHELAHILVGLVLGFKVSSISMNVFGFSAELYEYKFKKSYKKIITYLAGPIFNLMCAIIFYFSNLDSEFVLKIVYTNILLCVFNLLPILPLDRWKNFKRSFKKVFWK